MTDQDLKKKKNKNQNLWFLVNWALVVSDFNPSWKDYSRLMKQL